MTILLGVDTGGTYTDAVLIRDEEVVIASAKALTSAMTWLLVSVERCAPYWSNLGSLRQMLSMASLSTTLATNALVEGQGGRVALIYIGFREKDLDGHGLRDALKGDPCIVLAGGHNHAGGEANPLDEDALIAFLEENKNEVSGFAVASQFATRNPAHELRTLALVTQITGKPVSASHQLSAKLNGPKRAPDCRFECASDRDD